MRAKYGGILLAVLLLAACGGGGGGGGGGSPTGGGTDTGGDGGGMGGGDYGGGDTGGGTGGNTDDYQTTTSPDIECPATVPTEQDLQDYFADTLESRLRADCGECHVPGGEASDTQHIYTNDSQQNFEMFRALAGQFVVGLDIPLPAAKSSLQIPHEGGRQITQSSQLYMDIVEFGTMVAQFNNCGTGNAPSAAMKQAASELACEVVAHDFLGAASEGALQPRALQPAAKRDWSAAFSDADPSSAAFQAGVMASIAAWLDRGDGADPEAVAFFAKRFEQRLAKQMHGTEVMTCASNPQLEVADADGALDPAVYRAWRDVIAEMLLAGGRTEE